MRLTLSVGAAIALAVAGVVVFVHTRAVAQQAAAAQREAAEAPASSARTATARPSAAEPSATPPATPAPPDRNNGYVAGPPAGFHPGGSGGAGYGPPVTYSAVPRAPYGGWQGGPPTNDPELRELIAQDQQLEAEVQALARQLVDTDDEKQGEELKQRLAAALEKQFDAQQKLREMEISRIETRVQKLRDLVRKRTDSRRKIIDNRYEQLLNDAEGLGWNSAAATGVQYVPQGLAPRLPNAMPAMGPGSMPSGAIPAAAVLAGTSPHGPQPDAAATSVPESDPTPNATRRRESIQRLKEIGVAMQTYADTNKRFPAAAIYDGQGRPLLSWRVALLPYIGQDALYKKFHLDEPWDSEHNRTLLKRTPEVYCSLRSDAAVSRTSFVVPVGPGSMFDGKNGAAFQDILDGTSNTLMVFEADDEHAVPWTKPDDYTFDPDRPSAGFTSPYPDGRLILFGDGHVQFIQHPLDDETIRRLILRNDGNVLPALR